MQKSGSFVISLDFELHWGVFEHVGEDSPYITNLKNTPDAIRGMLELFRRYEIAATWATVGFLFAENRKELQQYHPQIKPNYKNTKVDPYRLEIGENEQDDPLHFAPSLIREIQSTSRQEIATHTYSHFFCLEEGATPDAFRADLQSAAAIANKFDVDLHSIVFPRNQVAPDFLNELPSTEIKSYRGNSHGWMYQKNSLSQKKTGVKLQRAARLLDSYINLSGQQLWPLNSDLSTNPREVNNVPASFFLRPWSFNLKQFESLRLNRLKKQITNAARHGKLFHLWWHPHNFGKYTEENLGFLRNILQHVDSCRIKYGMKSQSMDQISGKH